MLRGYLPSNPGALPLALKHHTKLQGLDLLPEYQWQINKPLGIKSPIPACQGVASSAEYPGIRLPYGS
jgi:hypothetical protein